MGRVYHETGSVRHWAATPRAPCASCACAAGAPRARAHVLRGPSRGLIPTTNLENPRMPLSLLRARPVPLRPIERTRPLPFTPGILCKPPPPPRNTPKQQNGGDAAALGHKAPMARADASSGRSPVVNSHGTRCHLRRVWTRGAGTTVVLPKLCTERGCLVLWKAVATPAANKDGPPQGVGGGWRGGPWCPDIDPLKMIQMMSW